MSELAAGFRAGTQMAQSALDAYDRSKRAGEESERREKLLQLQRERDAMLEAQKAQAAQEQRFSEQGVGLSSSVATPAGVPTMLATTPVAADNMSPVLPPAGIGAPRTVQFAQAAENLPTMSEADYLRSQADIYTGYGDTATAMGLMNQANALDQQEVQRQRYETELGFRENEERRRQQRAQAEQDELAREKQRRKNEAAFVSWTQQNPTASSSDMVAKLGELEITGQDALSFVKQTLGVRDEDIKRAQAEALREFNKNRTFDSKLTAYNDSDVFSPGFSLEWDADTKELVELDDSGKEISRNKFSNKNEAQYFLSQRAQDEDVALKYIVDRDSKATQNTLKRMREDREFNLKVMESVQDKYNDFVKNNPMLRGDELDKAYDKIYNETVRAVSQGLTLDPSASTRGMPTSSKYGGTTPDSTPAPDGQGGGLGSDRTRQDAREQAGADREYPPTPQEVEAHNNEFPDWVKYADPGQLIKMANEGDGIVINFLKNHPLNKFRELLGSFEQVPTARERAAQGTSARSGL